MYSLPICRGSWLGHYPSGAQYGQLLRGNPLLREHGVGMLTEQGSGTAYLRRRPLEPSSGARLTHAARLRMIGFDDEFVGRHLSVGDNLFTAQDRGTGHVLRFQTG